MSVNTFSGHVFNNLYNYPLSIIYIVDPKPILGLPSVIDRT
jgi:hypothetical protein